MQYTYYCKKCKKKKNINHSITESPEIICDKCNEIMRIEIGKPLVQFKGKGFTKTSLTR